MQEWLNRLRDVDLRLRASPCPLFALYLFGWLVDVAWKEPFLNMWDVPIRILKMMYVFQL
jgi:hypothetical protein